jgi:hypothetical protein
LQLVFSHPLAARLNCPVDGEPDERPQQRYGGKATDQIVRHPDKRPGDHQGPVLGESMASEQPFNLAKSRWLTWASLASGQVQNRLQPLNQRGCEDLAG